MVPHFYSCGVSLLLMLLGRSQAKYIPSFAGPYITYVEKTLMCPPDLWDKYHKGGSAIFYLRLSHFNPRKPRQLQTLVGNLTIPVNVHDDEWVRITMAARSNNEWKENAFVFNFPHVGCSMVRTHMPALYRAFFNLDPNSKQPCVIPKGAYKYDRVPLNYTVPHFPVLPYGYWRIRMTAGIKGSEIRRFCLEADAHTIPAV